jgi:pilus assembly protein CpaF
VRVISKQIASAVQIIVQQARLSDGSRKITHITEVQGMEGDTLLLQDLSSLNRKGAAPDGRSSAGISRQAFVPSAWALSKPPVIRCHAIFLLPIEPLLAKRPISCEFVNHTNFVE